MEFGLLGPLCVQVGGRPVGVRSPKQRILLAALLLRSGRPVPVDELVDAIWAPVPPANPRSTVQVYVTRVRTLLEGAAPGSGAVIVTTPAGYLIDVPEDSIDLLRFQRRLEEADRAAEAADLDKEAATLADALAEWRGEPLVDVPSEMLQREVSPRLREQRFRATERRIDVDLRRGRHAEVVEELVTLTAQQPLRELLWLQLLTALHFGGRRGDALAAYQTARRHLADQLGIDPGAELQELHAIILAGRPPSTSDRPSNLPPVPRQLPSDVRGFTGRAEQLALLDALRRDGDGTPGTVVIGVISGTAGVGKTTLAVRWARRVADTFPDGQLWINLRGYDPGHAVAPEQALSRFLRALGVPGAEIPLDPDEQAGLYRSLMDGRRALVVLDNARGSEQVRPLLPGAPGCVVLVTSRSRLTGLVAAEAGHLLTLDVLPPDEAHDMLARRLGPARLAAEPDATAEIIARCARLPLALAVAAAHAVTDPERPLGAFADELRHARGTLDALDGGDVTTDVRTVFSWSYRAVSTGAARLFRLLGLHPGPDLGTPAAASLTGLLQEQVRPLLDELTRANLLSEPTPGRYALHDLLRAYATELTMTEDTDADRHTAEQRMLDHYLHTAYAAARLLNPNREPVTLAAPAPATTPEEPADHNAAVDWFTTEHPVLLAAIDHAATAGRDTHAWQVAWSLTDFLDRRGRWSDLVAVEQAAVAAAHRLADPTAEARAHTDLADVLLRLGRPDDAYTHLQHALDLSIRAGDQVRQARTHYGLADLWQHRNGITQALFHSGQALTLFRAAGHRGGQAHALNAIGWFHARLDQHEQALTHCRQALALLQELGDREGQAHTWDSLGFTHHRLGQYAQSITCYQHAVDLLRELGNRYREATTLTRLGDTRHAAGDGDAALHAWRQALATLSELDHPDADDLRTKLRQHGP